MRKVTTRACAHGGLLAPGPWARTQVPRRAGSAGLPAPSAPPRPAPRARPRPHAAPPSAGSVLGSGGRLLSLARTLARSNPAWARADKGLYGRALADWRGKPTPRPDCRSGLPLRELRTDNAVSGRRATDWICAPEWARRTPGRGVGPGHPARRRPAVDGESVGSPGPLLPYLAVGLTYPWLWRVRGVRECWVQKTTGGGAGTHKGLAFPSCCPEEPRRAFRPLGR